MWVDGAKLLVQIYGDTIAAVASFKYLGVVLDTVCSPMAHLAARQSSFDRAAGLLCAGLSRIPSFPQKLVTYLWTSLVAPMAAYGVEVFPCPVATIESFKVKERKWWRKLLQVGGRAPNTSVHILMACPRAQLHGECAVSPCG